ncbi:zona pellucida sperm-binding protein 4-like isoform X2 [Hoplias malabaricus]
MEVATVSCDTNSSAPRCSPSGHCSLRPVVFNNPPIQSPVAGGTDLVPTRILPPAFKPGGCSVPVRQRVPCAHPGVAGGLCWNRGCCVDPKTSSCYYPMDECSADGHFVFAVPANISSTPLNPESLTVDGKRSCKPIISNKNVAIFKFSVTKCGTRSYRIGETTVFLAEVHSAVRTYTTHYGVITRDHQVKIMVECRYSKPYSGPGKGWASTGFMVKSSSLPSLVRGQGLFGVQLRIAEDETFSSFLSVHHQPLRVLLGKPVYLEVRLISPKPEATLLVHYCVAYPRSAKSALVLLYEGCPNPLDSENVSVLYNASQPQNRHQRRFKVKAFQFMDLADNKYLNEEIYFMCSTEVCMSSETPCKTTCFDRKP